MPKPGARWAGSSTREGSDVITPGGGPIASPNNTQARNGGAPPTSSASDPAARQQNSTMMTDGRPMRCAMKPQNGMEIIPTHNARLATAPASAIVMPWRSVRNTGTKLKYATKPALNVPHIAPVTSTGAITRHGGRPNVATLTAAGSSPGGVR